MPVLICAAATAARGEEDHERVDDAGVLGGDGAGPAERGGEGVGDVFGRGGGGRVAGGEDVCAEEPAGLVEWDEGCVVGFGPGCGCAEGDEGG